ncbi:nucleotide-diphospho-sugar transferase [Hyaloraphidium curvatum]|nr:nucleotide-diphospho-sugar transferase [Hyaloraphidium curvatum]
MAGGRTLIAFGAAFLWLFVVVAWLGSDRGKAFAGSADPAVPASRSPRRLAPRGLSKLSALSPNNNKTSNSSPLAQFLSKAQPRVPKLVHFIYGLDQSRVPEFGFIQWLSIVSAYESIRPERIFFWHRGEPRGEWWERAKHFITDRRQARDVTSVFGNPIANYAHKADILRLEILIEHGGIYLDQDTVVWRSLDELLGYECVMGHEGEGGWVGLGNAVIIAQPRSRFLSRWLRSYHNFDDANWNYHSIILPRILAAENPREVHVLDYTRFFWPLWNENGLQKFYVEKVYDFGKLGFTNHLWESKALRFVLSDAANAPTLEQVDLPIYCGMRRFLKVQPPGPRMKDSSGAYCWHNQEAPAEMPEPEPACRILDGPLDNSTLVSYYDFDRDRDHPLKLLDSSGHHLNGWFLSFRTPDVQDVSQIPGFATYPPPFGTVRSFDGSRGDYAILPTLRTYGQSFHAFTLSLWLRFDSQAAATADRMAVAEVVGDCDTFGTHDRCPSLHVQLKRAKRAPAPFQLGKANREANQRPVQGKTDGPWICEAAMHERRAGDSWIVVKLARIDVWEGVKEHMLPDVWYRVQVSASRRSQKLRLQVWKGAFEGAARFTVEKIADLSNGYYTPSSIVPVRFRNIWLGGPWHLLKDAHDASNYFTGQMDRVVISSTEVENAEDLAEGRTSLDLAPSFGVVDAAELELRQQDDLDSMLRAAGSGSRLRKRLAGAPVPMSLSERARQVLDSLILAAALEPVTFIFVVFGPLGVYLLRSSRRLRKFAWMGFLGFLTVVVVLEAGCLASVHRLLGVFVRTDAFRI